MRVLVVNAGSSSLKVDLVEGGVVLRSYDGLPEAATLVVASREDLQIAAGVEQASSA